MILEFFSEVKNSVADIASLLFVLQTMCLDGKGVEKGGETRATNGEKVETPI